VNDRVAAAAGALCDAVPWSCEGVVAAGDWRGRPIFVSDPGRSPSLEATGTYVTDFFGPDLAPGDAAISNDPFAGASHVTEFTLVARARGATVLVRMRVPDIGGFELGGLAPQSFDTWGEGARFPALRIAAGGRPREEALALVTLNSRTPALLRDALATMRAVADDVAAVLDAEEPLADGPRRMAAAAAGEALEALRPGVHRADAAVESPVAGRAPVVRVELSLGDGRPRLSLARSDAQLEAPLNSPAAHTHDCCLAAFAAAVPGFPLGPGALDAVEIDAGAGTITGATLPAITGLAPYHTARAIRRALSAALREAGAAQVEPDGWWQTAGRAAYEARVDRSTLRIATSAAAAFIDLERRRAR
jgi:N-methylhydantoinase B/oxoprolinase/acetone carboxylase alpha subunit